MDDTKLLEMFDLFQCKLISGEIDADHYTNLIHRKENTTKISPFAFLFLGFVGGCLMMANDNADIKEGEQYGLSGTTD